MIFLKKIIRADKAAVMPGVCIFLTRIAETRNNTGNRGCLRNLLPDFFEKIKDICQGLSSAATQIAAGTPVAAFIIHPKREKRKGKIVFFPEICLRIERREGYTLSGRSAGINRWILVVTVSPEKLQHSPSFPCHNRQKRHSFPY